MEKTIIFACLLSVLLMSSSSPPAVMGKYYSKSRVVPVPLTQKKTELHFFMHDIISGNTPTAVNIAAPKGVVVGEGNIGPFGAVYVFDDPLTVTADPKSEVVGNGRGFYTVVSIDVKNSWMLLFTGDIGFTSGKYNGSSISVFSRDPLVQTKELAIVGGRGQFRMAKGFLIINMVYFNATNGDAILEFNCTVFHQ
uniref:dirigent protein 4-like n=1 Tax=Erigeron canadensis TaxID=72917 RepID=UPI001CB92529|nr:dirigent protein 4-like [Erigeron canadensis]